MLCVIVRRNSLRLAWGGKPSQPKPVRWERWQPLARRGA